MVSRSSFKFAALHRVTQVINSSLELEEVLNLVMDSLIEITGAERGFVMLLDEKTGDLAFKVARNMDKATIEASSFQISRNIVHKVSTEGNPLVVTDALSDPRFSEFASVAEYHLRSIMCSPIRVKDRTIGVCYVDNRLQAGVFSQGDLDLLVSFANQAGIAIENARLYENVKQHMREITQMKDYQDNIFGSVTSGIIALDPGGRITSFNAAAEAILGTRAAEALGKPYTLVLGDSLSRKILSPMIKVGAKAGGHITGYEVECTLPNRGKTILSLSLSPLRESDGQTQGLVLVVDDLTEKKALEEARQREEEEKKRIRGIFGRYVAQSVVDKLLLEPDKIALGGKRQEVSVLFADIRGYTSLSEQMRPEEVVDLLNNYLALATKAIFRNEGTLDKYIGDAVMAIFNAPLPQPDHALAAVRAAVAMQEDLKLLAPECEAPVGCGVGVNTGEAVVGNIGTAELMNFTVIGDAVNVAQRLQSNAKAGEILVSQSTYEQVSGLVEAEPLEPMAVKGRTAPVMVYRVVKLR